MPLLSPTLQLWPRRPGGMKGSSGRRGRWAGSIRTPLLGTILTTHVCALQTLTTLGRVLDLWTLSVWTTIHLWGQGVIVVLVVTAEWGTGVCSCSQSCLLARLWELCSQDYGQPRSSRVSASIGMNDHCDPGSHSGDTGELCIYLPKILPSTRDLTALNSMPEDRLTWLRAFWSTCPMRRKHQHTCHLSVTWQEAKGSHGMETQGYTSWGNPMLGACHLTF